MSARTRWRFDSEIRSGIACHACGTDYETCTAGVLNLRAACCSGCRYTDTHDERTEMTTDPDEPADMLLGELVDLREQLKALRERVEVLETGRHAAPPPDPLADKIVEFMRGLPGVRLTALVISQNIGEDNGRIGGRLQTLASRGTIESAKEDGRTRMYWWPAGGRGGV